MSKDALTQSESCQCSACKVTPHASDCAVHSEPAYPKGKCDCGAQPEQEPVVWMYQDKSTHEVRFQKHMRGFVDHGATYETPLYTAPPQRTWVGLTDEEVIGIGNASSLKAKLTSTGIIIHPDGIKNFAQTIEAKLKEKNT